MSTYSSKITALKLVANHLELFDAVQVLTSLRKNSDIMEIIGHPRNPRNAMINDEANRLFTLFRGQLSKVQNKILEGVLAHSNMDTARRVGEICQDERPDEEKLDILTHFLNTHVPKTLDSLVMQP